MIRCGWCENATANRDRCTSCGHEDPARPYVQRNLPVPVVDARKPGRPIVTPADAAARLSALPGATDQQLADHFGVDPRTVRHWRAKVSG